VANITASRVGTEKIRKMRFFQPRDYIAVDYATNHASISSLAPSSGGAWPGVRTQVLEIQNVEPLRAEIESFLTAAANRSRPDVSGEDGKRRWLSSASFATNSSSHVRTSVGALLSSAK
jgi:hypothetical protein